MGQTCVRLTKKGGVVSDSRLSKPAFAIEATCWTEKNQCEQALYFHIVNQIIQKPETLVFHVQRIYHCYRLGLAEKLYAGLLDLLWVLNGKGRQLSQRMISSCRSILTEQQLLALEQYREKTTGGYRLPSQYSVLTTGLSGTDQVLKLQDEKVKKLDILQIAQDYIEYSQLDAAIETLEQAVLEDPLRMPLQDELLQIYKASNNYQAFAIMYQRLKKQKLELSDDWQKMADYFAGIMDEA